MASAADRSVVSSFVAAKLVSTVLLFEVWDAIKWHVKKREFKSLDPNPNPSFECFLWPIEQVWLLGLLALFLLLFSLIYSYLDDWINLYLIINFFCLLFSTSFSLNVTLYLAIRLKHSISEAIYNRLNRFGF